jgi:hypothetical protein
MTIIDIEIDPEVQELEKKTAQETPLSWYVFARLKGG